MGIAQENIKSYLSDADYIMQQSVTLAPTILFTNSRNNVNNGDILLFDKFGIGTRNSISLNSEITTHYTESNTYLNDQWAIKPQVYTVSGLVGEVIYQAPKFVTKYIKEPFIDKLKPLEMFSPTISSYTQSAINTLSTIESSVERYSDIARNIFAGISGTVKENNQRFIYEKLINLVNNRQLISVYTPFYQLEDMAIVSVSMTQGDNKFISDIEIQLQQWRTSETSSRQATEQEKNMLSNIQKADIQDNGIAQGSQKEFSSTAYKIYESLKK